MGGETWKLQFFSNHPHSNLYTFYKHFEQEKKEPSIYLILLYRRVIFKKWLGLQTIKLLY